MFCTNCGAKHEEQKKFCDECGYQMIKDDEPKVDNNAETYKEQTSVEPIKVEEKQSPLKFILEVSSEVLKILFILVVVGIVVVTAIGIFSYLLDSDSNSRIDSSYTYDTYTTY